MISKLSTLKNHIEFIRYFKNTSWMMGEQFLRIISGLFVGIWVARYLGPEKFGLFSYVLAFTAIFGGISKLGLDGIMVRELVNRSEKHETLLGTAFWLKFYGALFVMGLIVAIIPFTDNDAATNLYVFIIAAGLIFQSFEVVEFYFQSQVLAKIISICKIIQLTLSSIIKIYLVFTEAGLIWFIIVTLFDAFSLATCYFIAYHLQKKPIFFKCFDLRIARQLLKDSWPLIFSAIVVMIYMRIDQVMIKEMLGEYEVGIYSAAVRLSEAFYFIPIILTASLFPSILNAKNLSNKLYKRRLQQLYTFMIWLAISISIPMTIFSDSLIDILYGQAYQEASKVLMIHIWAASFVFLGVSFSKYLLAENLAKIAFQRTLLGAISNFLLNLWLIPIYGIEGAALGTLIAQFIANLMYDAFDKRLHQQLKMKAKAFSMPWKLFA